MMAATLAILLALIAQQSGPQAEAPDKPRAQALLDEGLALYERRDLRGALAKFKDAFAAYPSPKLWFNIGQAHRDLGNPLEARDAFERFLTGASDAAPETLAAAQMELDALEKELGRLRIECATMGAELALDGRLVGRAPVTERIWATPGHHMLTARHAGDAATVVNVDLKAGAEQTVAIRLGPAAAPSSRATRGAAVGELRTSPPTIQPPPPSGDGWWLGRRWAWVAAASTVVLAGGATTFGLLMQSKYDDLKKSCGSASPTRPGCAQSDLDSLDRRKTTANILWILAGASAATTGVLFLVEGHAVAVAPLASESVGLSARVEF